MVKNALRLSLAFGFALAMLMSQQSLAAAGIATFTVTVKSAFLKTQPGFSAVSAYSVFQTQQYTILGRTADSSWLQLDFAGASTGAPWVRHSATGHPSHIRRCATLSQRQGARHLQVGSVARQQPARVLQDRRLQLGGALLPGAV